MIDFPQMGLTRLSTGQVAGEQGAAGQSADLSGGPAQVFSLDDPEMDAGETRADPGFDGAAAPQQALMAEAMIAQSGQTPPAILPEKADLEPQTPILAPGTGLKGPKAAPMVAETALVAGGIKSEPEVKDASTPAPALIPGRKASIPELGSKQPNLAGTEGHYADPATNPQAPAPGLPQAFGPALSFPKSRQSAVELRFGPLASKPIAAAPLGGAKTLVAPPAGDSAARQSLANLALAPINGNLPGSDLPPSTSIPAPPTLAPQGATSQADVLALDLLGAPIEVQMAPVHSQNHFPPHFGLQIIGRQPAPGPSSAIAGTALAGMAAWPGSPPPAQPEPAIDQAPCDDPQVQVSTTAVPIPDIRLDSPSAPVAPTENATLRGLDAAAPGVSWPAAQQILPPGPRSETAAPVTLPTQSAPITPESLSQQVAHLVVSQAADRAELLLEPAELGRLRFEITQRGEGVQVIIMAERPETLDLLRRNGDQLLGDLRSMGFTGSDLSFGSWGGQPSKQDQPELSGDFAEPAPFSGAHVFNNNPAARRSGDGLDLRL